MAKAKRVRLDTLLVDRGLFSTRSRAAAAVLAGDVSVNGSCCTKAGTAVDTEARIDVKTRPAWVSRSAEKLDAGFKTFDMSCSGSVALDVGAGSGGFTQVLLDRGASKVYAVDVGYGQFDARLRGDPRLNLMERKNARELTRADIPEPVAFLTMDVSFISIFLILPVVRGFLTETADGIILFKPNFEAEKGEVQKGGLLLDPVIHRRLLTAAVDKFSAARLRLVDIIPSPIRGRDGNVEYLMRVSASAGPTVEPQSLQSAVDRAFGCFTSSDSTRNFCSKNSNKSKFRRFSREP